MEPDEVSFKFYDRPHPEDDIRLEVSYAKIPPVDWSGLPLVQLLDDVVAGDHRKVTSKGATTSVERDGLRLVWTGRSASGIPWRGEKRVRASASGSGRACSA